MARIVQLQLLAILAACALVAAGCGGSGTASTPGSPQSASGIDTPASQGREALDQAVMVTAQTGASQYQMCAAQQADTCQAPQGADGSVQVAGIYNSPTDWTIKATRGQDFFQQQHTASGDIKTCSALRGCTNGRW